MAGHGAVLVLPREQAVLPSGHAWHRLPAIGAALAGVGALGCLALGGGHPKQFFFSWLVAFVYFLTIALGCLYFVLIHSAMTGSWGVVVRRIAENGAATLPVLALAFVPLLFGMQELFPWARPEAASDHLLRGKSAYLNPGFFYARAAVYLLVWSGLAFWVLRLSRRQDETPDAALAARLRRLSGPALIPLGLTTTFAAVDWLMSLDPHWYSTMFGVYAFSGALVGGFAFLSLVATGMRRAGLLREAVSAEHFHDLGKLLFAFTVFWAYIAFSQFFLIWYANIPEETIWFKHRLEGDWASVSLLLAFGHFALPFFFLMPRSTKRNPTTLGLAAAWMLTMHLVDVYWLVMPGLHAHGPEAAGIGLDVAALLAVGGLFLAAFGQLLRAQPLVPLGDPRLPDSLGFENV